MIKTIS